MKKEKVLVAMSGGVDSSVVAVLLLEEGYDVSGFFAVNYDENGCWHGDYQDAVRVAAKLGIPLLKLDFCKEYEEKVLDYMFVEYKKGRTPNPDVLCNKYIKFGVWLDKAKELGFAKLATGHYAGIKTIKQKNIKTIKLMCAKDKNKDQTYFLHQLSQEQLGQALFPLGKYTKKEVRKLAKKYNLPTANKEESMGICFVGEVPMKEFLQKQIKPKPGKIFTTSGQEIGEHEGLAFYTLGQRHGFPQAGGDKPLFVVKKDFANNVLVVGYEDDPLLFSKEVEVEQVHWIGSIQRSPKGEVGQKLKFPLKCKVRLRHRQELQGCNFDGKVINFNKPQRAVTSGQFAVFYKGQECLGGGVVK